MLQAFLKSNTFISNTRLKLDSKYWQPHVSKGVERKRNLNDLTRKENYYYKIHTLLIKSIANRIVIPTYLLDIKSGN